MSKENASKFKSLDNEFDFYLKFTKPFVLNKSNSEDRALSVMWIKKLMNEQDKKLRLDYLKLLLYALQKPTMIGRFRNLPPDELEPLPDGLNIMELIDKVLEEPEKENVKEKVHPTISTAVSHDLTEYAAIQKIPNFGVQCFYAASPISINQWHLPSNYVFPRKYIYGAESWERSLSHLYHTDLAGHLVRNLKTEEKATMDCCKDKPKPCKKDNEDILIQSGISGSDGDDTIVPLAPNKREDRGPKSPPWSTPAQACQPCNQQNNRNNNNVFTWDEQSRLDSSYNIQPNCTLHEDFILNKHGLAQFETDQIALLLAYTSGQKNVDKNKCKKDTTKSLKSKTIYNKIMMTRCIQNDIHPSKLNVHKSMDDDADDDEDEANCRGKDTEIKKPPEDSYCAISKTTHPSQRPLPTGREDEHDRKESTHDSFDNCPWEDSPEYYPHPQETQNSCNSITHTQDDDNTKTLPKTQQELTRLFEQEIPPVPIFNQRFERFNPLHKPEIQRKGR